MYYLLYNIRNALSLYNVHNALYMFEQKGGRGKTGRYNANYCSYTLRVKKMIYSK